MSELLALLQNKLHRWCKGLWFSISTQRKIGQHQLPLWLLSLQGSSDNRLEWRRYNLKGLETQIHLTALPFNSRTTSTTFEDLIVLILPQILCYALEEESLNVAQLYWSGLLISWFVPLGGKHIYCSLKLLECLGWRRLLASTFSSVTIFFNEVP